MKKERPTWANKAADGDLSSKELQKLMVRHRFSTGLNQLQYAEKYKLYLRSFRRAESGEGLSNIALSKLAKMLPEVFDVPMEFTWVDKAADGNLSAEELKTLIKRHRFSTCLNRPDYAERYNLSMRSFTRAERGQSINHLSLSILVKKLPEVFDVPMFV
jgi:transcriptional regulator with XRE-family HTH domain